MKSYKVVFTIKPGVVIDKQIITAKNESSLDEKVAEYIKKENLLEYIDSISWEATILVAKGTISKLGNNILHTNSMLEEDLEEQVQCIQCSETVKSGGVKYQETYASGDYYTCTCGHEFHA